ncbi:hypothetical protein HPB52_010227 [Rhipicephalus sanguineus]|uniref:Uncharacterized protein n=1 Tax=Rhipicephalus sanguineus TaxID=34632 RepID=A0A9D4SZV0_RHISA|nr:hypothetical protein HPB52_010227 [Rhipicephalus sanguineus]
MPVGSITAAAVIQPASDCTPRSSGSHPLKFSGFNDVAFDDLRAGGVLIPAEITLEDFADADKDLELCAELTDDEIIHQVTEDSDDSDTENEEPAPTQPTSSELTRALITLSLVYIGNMTLTEIEADIIARKRTVQKTSLRPSADL